MSAGTGLTAENYRRGFLIDEELMGGVSENRAQPGSYIAFVLRHTTGEYLGYQACADLEAALSAINSVQRDWTYEKSSGCGGCKDGSCGRGSTGCRLEKKRDAPAGDAACPNGSC